jgi:hypothetical protein
VRFRDAVQIDALAVRLRPRTPFESVDLGLRLCQHAARSIYPCYALVALPIAVLALASSELADGLPILVIWWAKPWLDRTILFVLSRAAFGQRTTPRDVWTAQRHVWWTQLLFNCTVQRLSLWRSLTAPVYQLEGLSVRRARPRIGQIRRRTAGQAAMATAAFVTAEAGLVMALVSLAFWMAPVGGAPDALAVMAGEDSSFLAIVIPAAYALTVMFLEPFFVAAGFAMYMNRRAELEAWDIEQEFRRAFTH